jgi:hypothetical protein
MGLINFPFNNRVTISIFWKNIFDSNFLLYKYQYLYFFLNYFNFLFFLNFNFFVLLTKIEKLNKINIFFKKKKKMNLGSFFILKFYKWDVLIQNFYSFNILTSKIKKKHNFHIFYNYNLNYRIKL